MAKKAGTKINNFAKPIEFKETAEMTTKMVEMPKMTEMVMRIEKVGRTKIMYKTWLILRLS